MGVLGGHLGRLEFVENRFVFVVFSSFGAPDGSLEVLESFGKDLGGSRGILGCSLGALGGFWGVPWGSWGIL